MRQSVRPLTDGTVMLTDTISRDGLELTRFRGATEIVWRTAHIEEVHVGKTSKPYPREFREDAVRRIDRAASRCSPFPKSSASPASHCASGSSRSTSTRDGALTG